MKVDPNCVACGGTGKNSRGNPCRPCQVNGTEVVGCVCIAAPNAVCPTHEGKREYKGGDLPCLSCKLGQPCLVCAAGRRDDEVMQEAMDF